MPLKPSDKKASHTTPKKQSSFKTPEKVRPVIVEILPVVKQEMLQKEEPAIVTPVESPKSISFKELVNTVNQQQKEPFKFNFIK